MAELLLDSSIRVWVFLPLVIITFLFGVIRHYVTILFTSEKKADLQSVADTHVLMRSRMLRENGRFLPRSAFHARKSYLTHFFESQTREANMKSPMTDPSMLSDMLKGNMLNMIPMLVIGGWINWAFTGFLTTKIPFPLTYRFKPMLQRGCESLVSLDASWVSSASWYFLNIFGLRSMYTLVLGQDNAADQARMMQENMGGMMNVNAMNAANGVQDFQKAFKAEREALEVEDHKWALDDVDEKLGVSTAGPEAND